MTPVPIQPMRVFKEITGGFFLVETAMFLSLQVLGFEVNSIWAQGAGHKAQGVKIIFLSLFLEPYALHPGPAFRRFDTLTEKFSACYVSC
jgi:hypothetical protein